MVVVAENYKRLLVDIFRIIHHFISEFMQWTLPPLNLDTSIVANKDISQKSITNTANSIDPSKTTHYEPSHLDLHCLHKHLLLYTGLKKVIHL